MSGVGVNVVPDTNRQPRLAAALVVGRSGVGRLALISMVDFYPLQAAVNSLPAAIDKQAAELRKAWNARA